MEEEKKIIIQKEAKNKIIQKLRNRKIDCLIKDIFREDIGNENFTMEVSYSYYYGSFCNETKNYDKVNIQISTKTYPHIRRRLNKFDIMSGDYSELIEKVKFIIQEDIKKREENQVNENKEKKNYEILKEKLQGLEARKEQYGDSFIIKTKYFKVYFNANEKEIFVRIEDEKELTIEQAIEMINKLRG